MTSLFRTLQRNATFSALSSVVRLATNAVLFILVARAYGPEAFGQFTTAHTLSIIFTLFADFGFDLLLTTAVARNREQASFLFPRIFSAKMVCTIIVCIVMCLYGQLQPLSEPTRILVFIFSGYLLFSALLNNLFALFRAHDQLHHETRITFVINIVLLAALVLLGSMHAPLYVVAVAFVLSRVIGVVMAWHRSTRVVTRRAPIFDLSWLKSVWREIMAFGLYFVFGNLFFTIDTMLLSVFKGDYYVGIYQAVFRIVALLLVLPEVAVSAILPSLARFYTLDQRKWTQLGVASSKVLFFIGILIGVVLITSSDLVVSLIYGSRGYEEAIPVMRIFGGIIIVRYAFAIPGMMLTTSARQPALTLIFFCATALSVGLNLYFQPIYGIYGAAFVSLFTNSFVLIAITLALRPRLTEQWFSFERMVPLGYAVLGCLALLVIPSGFRIVGLAAFILTYPPVVYLAGLNLQERRLVTETTEQLMNR